MLLEAIFGPFWGRFWVQFWTIFGPFWGDDDDDDDVHVRRHENLNLTTYVSLFQTRSPELRAAALAEGLYNFRDFLEFSVFFPYNTVILNFPEFVLDER